MSVATWSRAGWHWQLTDLAKQVIEYVAHARGEPKVQAVPHRPAWSQAAWCRALYPKSEIKIWRATPKKVIRFASIPGVPELVRCREVRLYLPPPLPPPPPPVSMIRHTMGINIVEQHIYMSFTVQHFTADGVLSREIEQQMYNDLVEAVKMNLYRPYDEGEWWFDVPDPNLAVEEVPYLGGLICVRQEVYGPDRADSRFREIEHVSKRFARRMIREGQWFKRETLERWLPRLETE